MARKARSSVQKARSLALYKVRKARSLARKARSLAFCGSIGSELGSEDSEFSIIRFERLGARAWLYMVWKARSLALYSSKARAWHCKPRSLALYGSKNPELGIICLKDSELKTVWARKARIGLFFHICLH